MDTGEPSYFNRYSYTANDPINATDPTGMYTCADTACTTATIDQYPNPTVTVTEGHLGPEISVDLGPEITFNNDVAGGPSTNLPVTTETAKMVEGAVVNSGVDSVNINSTLGSAGVSRTSPAHPSGRAVDINEVNGQRVDSPANSSAVSDLQNAFAGQSNIRENYGPSRVEITGSVGSSPINRANPASTQRTPWGSKAYNRSVVTKHLDHIHASGQK